MTPITQASQLSLTRPLARIVGALIVTITVLAGCFWLADMATLVYQGHVEGRWYVDALDFRLSIYTQIVLSLIAIGAGLMWAVNAIFALRGSDLTIERRLTTLLIVVIVTFLALYSAHHWFETIVCIKGSIPSECTLYFKP